VVEQGDEVEHEDKLGVQLGVFTGGCISLRYACKRPADATISISFGESASEVEFKFDEMEMEDKVDAEDEFGMVEDEVDEVDEVDEADEIDEVDEVEEDKQESLWSIIAFALELSDFTLLISKHTITKLKRRKNLLKNRTGQKGPSANCTLELFGSIRANIPKWVISIYVIT
jgi:hypothetical protein